MKNAMKKIMSLVLVAMILVSALPFAASAAGFDVAINVDDVFVHAGQYETISYAEILALGGVDTTAVNVKQFVCDSTGTKVVQDGGAVTLDAPIFVYIWTEPKPVTPPAPPAPPAPVEPEMVNFWIELNVDGKHVDSQVVSVPVGTVMDEGTVKLYAENHLYGTYFGSGYTYDGCYDIGGKAGVDGYIGAGIKFKTNAAGTTPSNPSNPGVSGSNQSGYHKLSGTVTLRIQMKGTSTYKDVAIKDGIAADGKVTLNEVKSVVKYYYNAIEADTGIIYDGIYIDDSVYSLWMSYAHDVKYDTVLGLYDAAYNNNDVRLTVVISNAKLATTTSSNADSSNPKTGDSIMLPVAVMTVSASALAVAFYLNKKRAF